jgi:DNA-binding response OmpR family regulator
MFGNHLFCLPLLGIEFAYSNHTMGFKHLSDLAERPPQKDVFKAILLVDDDRQLVQTMQWILADQNFLVDKAFDGEEAMLKVRANEYDAVICDMMMPRLRGDEFYLQAVALRSSLANRFVFVTGFGSDPKIQRFLSTYRLKHFQKPVPIPDLVAHVTELVA